MDLDDDLDETPWRNPGSSGHRLAPIVTEAEQRGLAPLVAPHTLARALPQGSYRAGRGMNGQWRGPDGAAIAMAEVKEMIREFICRTCDFDPDVTLVHYLCTEILAPYLLKDCLLRFMARTVVEDADGLVDCEDLYNTWRKLPLVDKAEGNKLCRQFKANEKQWREMLFDRGFNIECDLLVGYRRKGEAS